jgi:hypothetical protein
MKEDKGDCYMKKIINENKYITVKNNKLYFKIDDFLNECPEEPIYEPKYKKIDNSILYINFKKEHIKSIKKIEGEEILKDFIMSYFNLSFPEEIFLFTDSKNCYDLIKRYCMKNNFIIKTYDDLYFLEIQD